MPINRIEDGIAPIKNKFFIICKDITGTAPPFTEDNILIAPPAGKLWRILNMYFHVAEPPGATWGTHYMRLLTGNLKVLSGESLFGSVIYWDYGCWNVADDEQLPNSDVAAQNALSAIYITKELPLTVRYYNKTDVDQTNTRYVCFSFIETSIL